MDPDKLRFQWDPHAHKESAGRLREKKKPEKMKRLEDYFNFIEQFSLPGDENRPDRHVDKKFSFRGE
ncbi:MAG: hypothetical protein JW913_04485 [Chitinispirillaceae bacterium]|nr:hypothetical protein [Chitinispirillaceae bacterium]